MNENETERESTEAGKRESASYPYFALHLALKIGDAVNELGGGNVAIQKSVLASHLKEDEKSPVLQQRIVTAKCFGIIEGRTTFTLSQAGKRYYLPTTQSERAVALLDFLTAPASFAKVIKRFDGSPLPQREILANIFHRDVGVPVSWKDRTAASFIKSAEVAGALDEAGFLRVRARKEGGLSKPISGTILEPMQETTTIVSPSKAGTKEDIEVAGSVESNVWNFSYGGKSVRLITPSELDRSLWAKLNAYVKLLEPSKGKGK